MANLTCKYMGLTLKSPVIVGSCGLTNDIEKMKQMEAQGAGAVVLKSIFEEQIANEVIQTVGNVHFDVSLRDAYDYIKGYTEIASYQKYTDTIRQAKKKLSIPVIASINCSSNGDWTHYAKRIEDAGADALELNIFFLSTQFNKTAQEIESLYFKIVDRVRETVKIPMALKVGPCFSALASMLQKLSYAQIESLVLFNRFYSPDIDVNTLQTKPAPTFEKSDDFYNTLRWIAIMEGNVKCDLCATAGIFTAEETIKQLLAGANAVQLVSSIYKNGIEHIKTINQGIEQWMNQHNYLSIDDFRGKMSYNNSESSVDYLRVQFMKHFAGIE